MTDPTYNREEIAKNPKWNIAFILSEHLSDDAPIGWSKYIGLAEEILESIEHRDTIVDNKIEKLQDKIKILKK